MTPVKFRDLGIGQYWTLTQGRHGMLAGVGAPIKYVGTNPAPNRALQIMPSEY